MYIEYLKFSVFKDLTIDIMPLIYYLPVSAYLCLSMWATIIISKDERSKPTLSKYHAPCKSILLSSTMYDGGEVVHRGVGRTHHLGIKVVGGIDCGTNHVVSCLLA